MGKCIYCTRDGDTRVKGGESKFASDINICEMHWKILKDPSTALPFLRGVIASQLRGLYPADELDKKIDLYIDQLSSWKPKN